MHILIVDDELLARSRLRTLLGDCDARHQVSEAAHAADALAQLNISGGRAVDLVLLDIHMPGQDGLALAQQIRRLPHPPTIVFVTAHADHALSAFELDAVDYLTKPVRLQRLQQALAKAQRASGQATSTPLAAPDNGETLLIQERGRTERVPLAEVLFLRAEQKYVTVRTATRSFIVDDALSELEARHARTGAALRRGRGRGLGRAPAGPDRAAARLTPPGGGSARGAGGLTLNAHGAPAHQSRSRR